MTRKELVDKVVDLYWNQGLSLSRTAKIIGRVDSNIRKLLKESGRGTRSVAQGIKKHHKTDSITDKQIIEMYDNGMSCLQISEYFGKSEDFSRQRLIKLGIGRRNSSDANKSRRKLSETDIEVMHDMYKRGDKVLHICQHFDIGMETMYRHLRYKGFEFRDRFKLAKKYYQSEARKNIDEVVELYRGGKNPSEIAEIFNVTCTVILNILKENNIEIRKAIGENHYAWKGGITKLQIIIRTCRPYMKWKKSIFKRDGHICQLTGGRGGELNAHHIKPFAQLLQEFLELYPDLDYVNDRKKFYEKLYAFEPLWDIGNGITLSKKAHDLLEKNIYDNELLNDLYKNKISIEQIQEWTKLDMDELKQRLGIKDKFTNL